MMGASILASKSCLRTGTGLVTSLIPDVGYDIIQISLPEAIVLTGYGESYLSSARISLNKYSSIGIGIGMGNNENTYAFLKEVLEKIKIPMVLDADALNIISEHNELLDNIPEYSILTPHPGEFARLFGASINGFDRIELQRSMAIKYKIFIVLKGKYTSTACPDGNIFFNSSGNAGMVIAVWRCSNRNYHFFACSGL
ncbi:MAG: ADP/ATP-dependent (S)-NAD(P)H-hydrate dehydratase [Saprospiraceae bacterium]